MKPEKFMPGNIMAGFLLYAETQEFQFFVERTVNLIKSFLKRYSNPYVAVSGGKDSSVLLHMITNQKKDIWIRHWDYGLYLVPRSIENEILNDIHMIAPQGQISYEMRPGGSSEMSRHSHIAKSAFFPRLSAAIKKYNWDLCFLGLRKQESQTRRVRIQISIKERGIPLEKKRSGFTDTAFPLADWTAKDIWAYIVKYSVPVCSVYKKLARIHGGWEETRLSTFFDDEFSQFGSHETSGLFFWPYRYSSIGLQKKSENLQQK